MEQLIIMLLGNQRERYAAPVCKYYFLRTPFSCVSGSFDKPYIYKPSVTWDRCITSFMHYIKTIIKKQQQTNNNKRKEKKERKRSVLEPYYILVR